MASRRSPGARARRAEDRALKLPEGVTRAELERFVREREWYQSYDFLEAFGVKATSDSEAKWRALKLPRLEGRNVLDLGCNTGYLTLRAIEAGAALAIGVDYDWDAIRTACTIAERIKKEPRAIFVRSQIEHFLDEFVSHVDVIIAASVAHYVNLPMIFRRCMHGRVGFMALELPYVPGSSDFHVSRSGQILIPGERALEAVAAAHEFAIEKVGESERLDEDERAVFHFVPLDVLARARKERVSRAAPRGRERGSKARAPRAREPGRARARARRRPSS